jgi:hypothetical protein
MTTTADNELRNMIGDLMIQIAMLRAEVTNQKAALDQLRPPPPQPQPNGRGHQPEQPGA